MTTNKENIKVEVVLNTQEFNAQLKRLESMTQKAAGGLKETLDSTAGSVQKVFSIMSSGMTMFNNASNGANGFSSAMQNLSATQGVAAKASTLLGGAMGALAGPIGIVSLVIAGVSTAMQLFSAASEEQVSELDVLKERIDQQAESWQQLQESQAKQYESDIAQIEHTKDLWQELQTLTDVNGTVKKGYEDRAAFIVGALNDAYQLDIEMTGNQIKNYGELGEKIDEVVAKQQGMAIVEAGKPLYEDAVSNLGAYIEEAAKAKAAYLEAEKDTAELQKAEDTLRALGSDKFADSFRDKINEKMKEPTEALNTANANLDNALNNISTHEQNIANLSAGKLGDIVPLAQGTADSWVNAENQVKGYQDTVTALIGLLDQATADNAKNPTPLGEEKIEQIKTQIVANIEKAKGLGINWGAGLEDGIRSKLEDIYNAAVDAAKTANDGFAEESDEHSPSRKARDFLGKNFSLGVAEGISQNIAAVDKASRSLANKAFTAMQNVLDIHSPSKVMAKQVGQPIALGVAKGIADKTNFMPTSGKKHCCVGCLWLTMALKTVTYCKSA